jgi:hypothetical protein
MDRLHAIRQVDCQRVRGGADSVQINADRNEIRALGLELDGNQSLNRIVRAILGGDT